VKRAALYWPARAALSLATPLCGIILGFLWNTSLGFLMPNRGILVDWPGRRDKALKTGTVPAKMGRMVCLYIKQKQFRCCELIFADKLFLTRKEHTKKIGKHHWDNCCLLFMIRNSIGPYGVFRRSHWGGTHGTKFHRSLWGGSKAPLGWDPRNKIWSFSNLKNKYKTFIDFYKIWNEQFWSINLQLNKISATFSG